MERRTSFMAVSSETSTFTKWAVSFKVVCPVRKQISRDKYAYKPFFHSILSSYQTEVKKNVYPKIQHISIYWHSLMVDY